MALAYPERIALARTPTPLQLLQRFKSGTGGPRIWVKRDDLTGFALSGNKVRKLEFCIADALAQGCDTLITCGGNQSNHCRATAVAARQMGLDVHLVLRADTAPEADGNLLIDQLMGAEITHCSKAEYSARLPQIYGELVEHYRAHGRKAYTMPVGASDEVGLWGYIAASAELQEDFRTHGINPAHIVCATGSGGTQGGLTLGVALHAMSCQVWGINVCDDAKYFRDKICTDIEQWQRRYQGSLGPDDVSIATIDGYVGPGYGKAGPEVYEMIAELARTEGLLLDPTYTGKAFYGLVEEIRQGQRFKADDDIVFIHTGGFFATYAQKQQFQFSS